MAKKVIFGALAFIVVVVAVVAIVATVTHNKGSGSPNGSDLSSSTKSLSAFCSSTLYPDTCQRSLSTVVNGSSSPTDVIKAAIKLSLDELKTSLQQSADIGKGVNDSRTAFAVSDCKELLQDAHDDLQAIVGLGNDIAKSQDNLRSWITAVMTFMDNCADGFDDPKLKNAMQNVLRNATELSSNALAIITNFGSMLEEANKLFNLTNIPQRRLMQAESEFHVNAEGFPVWLSAGDRKLLATPAARLKPNVVVAKDGSGQFKTIQAAINAAPQKNKGRYVIYVKAGVYDEIVLIPKEKNNIYMYGDGAKKTRVTGKRSFGTGYNTQNTATFSVVSDGFICKNMGFFNTAGPQNHQAVALRVISEFSAFYSCRMDGYQDTLYLQNRRTFIRNCVISGTVDFIFGNSAAVIQNCLIIVRKPMGNQQNTITAQGRTDPNQVSGIVIQNSRIVPEQALFPLRFKIPSYLGRPWKEYCQTVVMESQIGDLIKPEGYLPWNGDFALNTLYYAEYANRGPGANTSRRVRWKGFHVISKKEAQRFTAGPFLLADKWLKYTGVPNFLGFTP
ncbi:hypothetical protein LUZ60_003071 [Juncus effusus]|nr:hypothetical protein LUZ60_003071 [Juncus effusus]